MTTIKPKAFMLSIVAAASLAASPASRADVFPFRVAFENVPGVEEITSGKVREGIEILQQALEAGDADKGYVLATLCGAYIIDSSLEEAARVCTDAVEMSPGETAYNNRGVLRAFSGDFEGAREDFDRARPARMDEYLEYLKTRDVGLIAQGNSGLLDDLVAKHASPDVRSSVAMAAGPAVDPTDD